MTLFGLENGLRAFACFILGHRWGEWDQVYPPIEEEATGAHRYCQHCLRYFTWRGGWGL